MQQILRTTTAVALLLSVPVHASAKWTRLQTKNFVFIGDASESEIRNQAKKLEQFREVLATVVPGAAKPSPVPTVVIVFSSQRALGPYRPQFEGKPVEVAGYFQPGDDLNYIVVTPSPDRSTFRTIFHEYSHFIAGNAAGPLPIWVNEGLAEVYATFDASSDGKSATLGLSHEEHVLLLRDNTPMSLRELRAVTHSSPVYNEGSKRGVLYAESWALVHYLMFDSPARVGQLKNFIQALSAGTSEEEAFAKSFGDPARLEQELRDFLKQEKLRTLIVTFNDAIASEIPPRGEPFDEVEAQGHLGDLLARMNRVDEARTFLEGVLKQHSNSMRAALSLGLLHLRESHMDEALRLLRQAAEQAPTNAIAQSSYGRALVARMQEQLNDRDALALVIEQARTALVRAVQADPNASGAAAMLGYVELVAGTDYARAATMMDTAVRLSPDREQYRLMAGEAWIRAGDVPKATRYLGPLMASGTSQEMKDAARAALMSSPSLRPKAETSAVADNATTAGDPGAPPAFATATAAGATAPTGRRSRYRLDLRGVQPGETRVQGLFRAVECRGATIVLSIQTEARVLGLATKRLDDIDFISYVDNPPGTIACGTFAKPSRVLATYRARSVPADGIAGDVVAIELIPEDYTPPK